MKKHLLLPAFFVLLSICKLGAQNYLPIAATGYSLDGVAENTTAVSTTGGPMDDNDFVLYSQYYGTLYSSGAGLPNNGLISTSTRTYQLQNYTGPNVMHILAAAKDSLTLVTPLAYTSISLLGFGTQGAATASITIRFTDNTTQVFSPITMDDWFTANPAIYTGFDRVVRSTGVPALVGSAGNPRLFGFDLGILCANQGKPIKRIIVKNNSATSHLCVMAVAGNVPTYSVNPNPALICNGASITLTATGLTSYTWQPDGVFAGSNSTSITVSPTVTTTYTLAGDNSGCPGYILATVNVSSSAPVLSLAGSTQSICLGAAATITASGALAYTLTSPAANGGTFSPTITATYTVTGANGCGTSSLTTTVTVGPLIVTATTATALVCSGRPTTLTATGANSYTWTPGSNLLANYVASPLSNTIYTVVGKTGNCIGTNTIAISTTPLPTLSIGAGSGMICQGDSINLTVAGNALTYTWSPGTLTATSIYVKPLQLTQYTLVGTNAANCTNTVQQSISVNPNPPVTISISNKTVCIAGSSTLTAAGATTYSWNSSVSTSSLLVNPLVTSVYTVTGSYVTGCHSTVTAVVTVYSPTISAVSSETAICVGGSAVLTGGTAVSYTWSNGLPSQKFVSVSPSLTTVYTVTGSVNNQNGLNCPATSTVQVIVNPSPSITVTSSKTNSTICVGETILLTGGGAGSTGTYTWSTGTVTLATRVKPTITTTYTVYGMDANGCQSSAQITIKVLPCTGIENYSSNTTGILIYPNPSSSAVQINSQSAVDLMIISELGQPVRSLKLSEANAYHISIEGLAPGIYFVISANSEISFKQKIVITN